MKSYHQCSVLASSPDLAFLLFPRTNVPTMSNIIIIIMTRSDQPKPPAVAIVRQNGLSSASSRAFVADTPVSRQIWWTQVVDGRPQVRLHSCEGRSPSLVLVLIRRNRFAGTALRSLATWPKRPNLRLRTMYMRRRLHEVVPADVQDASLATYMEWKESSLFQSALVWGSSCRSRSHRVVRVTRTWSICGASWEYWACSDSRYSSVKSNRSSSTLKQKVDRPMINEKLQSSKFWTVFRAALIATAYFTEINE